MLHKVTSAENDILVIFVIQISCFLKYITLPILLLKKLKINVFVYRLAFHQLGKNADMEGYGKKIKSIWNYIKIN